MRLVYLAIEFLFYVVTTINSQDIAIYGRFRYENFIIIIFIFVFSTYLTAFDLREIKQIYGQCFNGILIFLFYYYNCLSGLGFRTCIPTVPTNNLEYNEELPYYTSLASNAGVTIIIY